MSKNIQDSLYQMLLKGLKVLFALFNSIGVVTLDWDKFAAEMDKSDDAKEAE